MFVLTDRQITDFKRYLNVIGKCGGCILMNDLPLLTNIEYKDLIENGEIKTFKYDKVARDIRMIEKLIEDEELNWFKTYVSYVKNEHGKPSNHKCITLTPEGWYVFMGVKNRPEIETIDESTLNKSKLNAFKNIINKEKRENHTKYTKMLLEDYQYKEQVYSKEKTPGEHIRGKVEVDKFLKDANVTIEKIEMQEENSILYIKLSYIRLSIFYKEFCDMIDKMLSVFERCKSLGEIPLNVKIEIEVDIINRVPLLPKKFFNYFNKYKRKYAYYALYHKKSIDETHRKLDEALLGSYKTHNIIRRFNFMVISEEYNLELY